MDYTKIYRHSTAKHEAKWLLLKQFAAKHGLRPKQVLQLCRKGAYGSNARYEGLILGWRIRDVY